jgi:hypothetical protein
LDRVVKVECHSGYTYAEKPIAVEMDGNHLEIMKIIAESRTSSGRKFTVRLKDGKEIELDYDENKDEWKIENGE